jgi:hypothetical protein
MDDGGAPYCGPAFLSLGEGAVLAAVSAFNRGLAGSANVTAKVFCPMLRRHEAFTPCPSATLYTA